MANETFQELWRTVRLHGGDIVPIYLARYWIKKRFRQVQEKRLWSWRLAEGQFLIPAVYDTGTVSVTNDSRTVTGTGTTWTASMVGQQFRVGTIAPIYTVASVDSTTQITLDLVYGGSTDSSLSYQILQAYLTPASDFQDFLSVKDVDNNWQLHLHVPQLDINNYDTQRSGAGTPWAVVDFRYGTSPDAGSVSATLQASGSGDSPVAGGTYSGRTDSTFVVVVTTGGVTGTAVFSWRKDDGTTNSGITTTEAPYTMSDGVTIAWPTGNTYVLNDVFVFRCKAGLTIDLPQYELYPYQTARSVYPYLYTKRLPDLDEASGELPRYIRGDILIQGALSDLARWPGVEGRKNPFFDIRAATSYEAEFQGGVNEMQVVDDEIYERDLMMGYVDLPYAPIDSAFMQTHGPDVYD